MRRHPIVGLTAAEFDVATDQRTGAAWTLPCSVPMLVLLIAAFVHLQVAASAEQPWPARVAEPTFVARNTSALPAGGGSYTRILYRYKIDRCQPCPRRRLSPSRTRGPAPICRRAKPEGTFVGEPKETPNARCLCSRPSCGSRCRPSSFQATEANRLICMWLGTVEYKVVARGTRSVGIQPRLP